ncbi:hypothetical protein [Nostoc piscinale]|uniref:hypothetical protein n=1 Tax=Nostoc piscinale TaxID=224012 RepID=UPI001F32C0C5|nr:hypothetical protein [Nostoc piscinale]
MEKEYFAIQCKAFDEKQKKDIWLYVRHMSKGWVPVSDKPEDACRFETVAYAQWASDRLKGETRVIKAPAQAQGRLYVSSK